MKSFLVWRTLIIAIVLSWTFYSIVTVNETILSRSTSVEHALDDDSFDLPSSLSHPSSASAFPSSPTFDSIKRRVLVVYSGPSSLQEGKLELYERNIEYFLSHGGIVDDCGDDDTTMPHDTVIVVGHELYQKYAAMVEDWKTQRAVASNQQQQQGSSRVWVVARRPVCYDMESARLAFYGGLGVNILDYDYFVFVNCGMTGPGPMPGNSRKPWTSAFTSKLTGNVKMSGLTINTLDLSGQCCAPHVQSFVYALDKVGIEVVLKSGAIFDCDVKGYQNIFTDIKFDIIKRYEMGMGEAILNAGYAMTPYISDGNPACSRLTKENAKDCEIQDIWFHSRLMKFYGGRMPLLNDTLFFKTSRLVPGTIAKEINFKAVAQW